MIKLIAADMDGTLLNSKGELSPRFFPLLQKLQTNGIQFAVASGRQYYNLLSFFEDYKDSLIFINENGSFVVKGTKSIFTNEIPEQEYTSVSKIVHSIQGAHLILCGIHGAYIETANPQIFEKAKMYFKRLTMVSSALDIAKKDVICKLAIYDEIDAETNAYPVLKQLPPQFATYLSGKIWVDVMHAEVNKGAAIQMLQKRLNILPEETMVFGDYLNDYEMMQTAKYSFAMANAHPDLKKISNFTAKSNDEDGVVEAILEALSITL